MALLILHFLALTVQAATPPGAQATTLDVVDKIVKIAAVILGGLWTYLNYARGRTFKRRLEPKIAGKIAQGVNGGIWLISGVAQVKNVGLSKVDIEASGTAVLVEDLIRANTQAGIPVLVSTEVPGGTLGIFERHRWIEPGETIEESFALPLPSRVDRATVRLRLRIVSRHKFFRSLEWNADSTADPPDPSRGASAQI